MNERITIFHVEDDYEYISYTQKVLDSFPNIQYMGFADNAEDGLKKVLLLKPDIVITDIEMPGKDGLWLANELKKSGSLIVFSTSHADYALNAFNAYCLHYLLKPITKEDLSEILDRYISLKDIAIKSQEKQLNSYINEYLPLPNIPKRIFINTHKKIEILQLDEVVFITAEGSYTKFVMVDQREVLSAKHLKIYSSVVEKNPDFIKIHRSYVINQALLLSIEKRNNDSIFNFINGIKIELSSFRKDEWMNKFF